MEMELLCDRVARESMEASGVRGDRRSLLHAFVLALQRRGKRPRCTLAPPVGPTGSTLTSAGGQVWAARAGAGHEERVSPWAVVAGVQSVPGCCWPVPWTCSCLALWGSSCPVLAALLQPRGTGPARPHGAAPLHFHWAPPLQLHRAPPAPARGLLLPDAMELLLWSPPERILSGFRASQAPAAQW